MIFPVHRFSWEIDNFSELDNKKLCSDVFTGDGYQWRVVIFPKGNNVVDDEVSMYLEAVDLPHGWNRLAKFSLAIVNQINSEHTVGIQCKRQFTPGLLSGRKSFMSLEVLLDPSKGFLVDDTCIVEVVVSVFRQAPDADVRAPNSRRKDDAFRRRMTDHWAPDSSRVEYAAATYDSRKETGYVGLQNQGATCYLNSLLQTLYHIPCFRNAVYRTPATENDSIPSALQRLFYELQQSHDSVATTELTKSFKWDAEDSFIQHDVQELNRILCERLEDRMKGTVVEGAIQELFQGHHINYIDCTKVDYKSTRKESFYDIQLDVKGCRDVYASFDKYVEVERLEGGNKYSAGAEHGLQDAKKETLFVDFPPVLQLHLKRFELDVERDTTVKINDRYEFPLQLDLDRDDRRYLTPVSDRRVRNLYTLYSVLVHSGGLHGGHYYAFIRPTPSDKWFKFDDERVSEVVGKQAVEEQYGGETKCSSAYMLVYIRESDRDKIMCKVNEDIAEHMRRGLKREHGEQNGEGSLEHLGLKHFDPRRESAMRLG